MVLLKSFNQWTLAMIMASTLQILTASVALIYNSTFLLDKCGTRTENDMSHYCVGAERPGYFELVTYGMKHIHRDVDCEAAPLPSP